MVSVLASSVVRWCNGERARLVCGKLVVSSSDRVKSKTMKTCVCCFSTNHVHVVLRSKTKDCTAVLIVATCLYPRTVVSVN